MTEIHEIPAQDRIKAYMMIKLTKEGNFSQLAPTFGTHKIMGGFWADRQEAQHEQMVKALLGEQYRVFEIDWKI
jgi:hypothetical protein